MPRSRAAAVLRLLLCLAGVAWASSPKAAERTSLWHLRYASPSPVVSFAPPRPSHHPTAISIKDTSIGIKRDITDVATTMSFQVLQVRSYESTRVLALSTLSASLTVSVACAQYNVFGRPYQVSQDGQRERLARIPASLVRISEQIDVVTFAEADIQDEREAMLAQFRTIGFAYATSILHDPDPFTRCVRTYLPALGCQCVDPVDESDWIVAVACSTVA